MSEPAPHPPLKTTNSGPALPQSIRRKPRVSLAIATAFGLGYLPKAPGTWGSLGGVAIVLGLRWLGWPEIVRQTDIGPHPNFWTTGLLSGGIDWAILIAIAILGWIVASRAARYADSNDPQYVVIDEVSGQMVAYLFPLTLLNWKSLLLGFILFRVFDIWKPFPARQAESLPGGLGIMADDWIAGIYAGIGLWVVRVLGMRLGLHLGF